MAKAVSIAEGFGPPENIATRANNPGNVTGLDGAGYQTLGTMNQEGVLHFANLDDGWDALKRKLTHMLTGRSVLYHLYDSLEQIGKVYSGGKPEWAINVARELGLPVTAELSAVNAKFPG
jgi:hypothetical protein